MVLPDLTRVIAARLAELAQLDVLPAARIARLDPLVDVLSRATADGRPPLVFVCTHNSRRSHMAQVWAAAAAARFGVEGVETHSAGLEATTVSDRAVAALRRAGFAIVEAGGDPPGYEARIDASSRPIRLFSKTLGHASLPAEGFAAIMVCAEADEACPHVPGATRRLSIPHEDPGRHDGTPQERGAYDTRCRDIARELLYVFGRVSEAGPGGGRA